MHKSHLVMYIFFTTCRLNASLLYFHPRVYKTKFSPHSLTHSSTLRILDGTRRSRCGIFRKKHFDCYAKYNILANSIVH